MVKLALIVAIAITTSCGTQTRKKTIQVHRPVATDPKAPNQPEGNTPGDGTDVLTPEKELPRTDIGTDRTGDIAPDAPNTDPESFVESSQSERLSVTAGTTESLSTFEFVGADARAIYKIMPITRETLSGSEAKYAYIKRGENIACERLVFATDLNTAIYSCKIVLKSQAGTAENASSAIVSGTADEKLEAAYNSSMLTIAPTSQGLSGAIRIAGPDAKTLFSNLAVEAVANKKIGDGICCSEAASVYSCSLPFRFDTGVNLRAN
jgi:hypothetical protein